MVTITLIKAALLGAAGIKLLARGEGDEVRPADRLEETLATIDARGTSPRLETYDEARRVMGESLTLDEYALARVINSEYGSGNATELCCVGDADFNKARRTGKSIFDHVTGGTGEWGPQETPRPVSSARAPGPRHVLAAIAVTRGAARGISRGAERYFDPKTQRMLSKQNLAKWCPPEAIIKKWAYAADWGDRKTCTPGKPGPKSKWQEWVGPIPGVNACELMLLRPATADHARMLAEAIRVIESC